jgi:hypothetical protein
MLVGDSHDPSLSHARIVPRAQKRRPLQIIVELSNAESTTPESQVLACWARPAGASTD